MAYEKTTKDYQYSVQNMVYTATFSLEVEGGKIDLNELCRRDVDAEYNPERFPGLVKRFDKPKATALIFSTGKAVITGLKRDKDIKDIVDKIEKMIKKSKVKVDEPTVILQNIVASGAVLKENDTIMIDLNLMAVVVENSMYEPEVFPGLIYRARGADYKSVFLVFSTGKFVCTGLKDVSKLEIAIQDLQKMLNDAGVINTNKDSSASFDDDELDFL